MRYDGGMNRTCIACSAPINMLRSHAKFCSTACRVSHSRSKRLPEEMTTTPRWVRHDASKRPLRAADGRMADWRSASSWATYQDAKKSTHGVGLGFVLSDSDDIACIDVDDCVKVGKVSPEALEIIDATPGKFLVEYSISGNGIHIWHHSGNKPGTNRVENGVRVERYSQARYIAVTGNRVKL